MAITDADVIESLQILTTIETIQTEAQSEATPEENTTADLLYAEFTELLDQAEEEFANDLIRLNLTTVSDITTKRALAYLIADYIQVGQPDWNAAKVQYNQDTSVSRFAANRLGSSYYYNYLRTLENAQKADDDYKERKSGVFIT
jgi:hypothetical protein